MSIAPHRFLGFAFACADLLVEIAPDDRVTFAVGAAGTLTGTTEKSLIGLLILLIGLPFYFIPQKPKQVHSIASLEALSK